MIQIIMIKHLSDKDGEDNDENNSNNDNEQDHIRISCKTTMKMHAT
jgi:hypothetical protein